MAAGIFSRTVRSVNECGPHLKSPRPALNAMSRLSRPQEQLLRVGCGSWEGCNRGRLVTLHFVDDSVGMDEFSYRGLGKIPWFL